jgi:hypothetical protein
VPTDERPRGLGVAFALGIALVVGFFFYEWTASQSAQHPQPHVQSAR